MRRVVWVWVMSLRWKCDEQNVRVVWELDKIRNWYMIEE